MAELEVDILDVFRPPPGYTFRRGLVLTHNCTWDHVTDTLAPTLAGCEDRNPAVRRRTAQAQPGMELLVLADSAETTLGPIHTWALLVPVRGRRQHAKAGLLEFVSATGQRRIRAYVGSANLTPSGTGRNVEIVVVDECSSRAKGKRLVADVAAMLRAAVPKLEVARDHRTRARQLSIDLTAAIACTPTGALVHSLNKPVEMLAALGDPREVERVVVVSPPFAARTDDGAATAVAPWIGSATSVTLITQPGDDGVLRFSDATLKELRRCAGNNHFAVRTVGADPDDPDAPPRPLHAKLVGVVADGRARVMVGSANFSSPGLLGRNREAVVALDLDADDLDDLLAGLPTEIHRGPVGKQPDSARPAEGHLPFVTVTFEPDPHLPLDLSNLVGTVHIDAPGAEVVAVYYDDRKVVDWEHHPVAIREDLGVVTVKLRTRTGTVEVDVPVEVHLTAQQLDNWPHTDTTDKPTDLERLLGTIRKTARSSPAAPSTPGKPGAAPTVDDKLTIPLEQRLVLLARYRAQVAPLVRAYWNSDGARLERLLKPDEMRIARALFGLDTPTGSPVLQQLAAAADALHETGGTP